VILVGLILLLYASVIKDLVLQWWTDVNYGHGFFVPLFSSYILWHERERWTKTEIKPNNFGLVVMLGAVGLLLLGSLGAELFVSRFSLLVLLAGMILFLAGWKMLRAVSFPLSYLIWMIPIPVIIFNQITFPLQLVASRLATAGLELLQVPVLRDGNVLVMSNYSLEVVEACSGIRSLMTLIALAVAYVYLFEPRRRVRYVLTLLMNPDCDCHQRDSHLGCGHAGTPLWTGHCRRIPARIFRLAYFLSPP
jgi:exosortase